MLWDKTGTHQPESLCAMLQSSPLQWDGITAATLSVTWSCPCGRVQAFCSTYAHPFAADVWGAAQAELTGLCQLLGLTEDLVLSPVSSSDLSLNWGAYWRRARP